jgi:cysteine-rich repeat protein
VLFRSETCDDGNTDDGDGCNATCAAATCYVPVTHATVADALADTACPTVYVHSGTHPATLTITRDVALVGVGAEPSVLDGGRAGSVVTIGSGVTARLAKLTLRNGQAPQGAGILSSGSLTLDSVIVTENVAQDDSPSGGGIANLGGSLTLNGSQVVKNHLTSTSVGGVTGPSMQGAGIFSSGGIVRVEAASLIEGNDITATIPGVIGRGAGINATTTALTITRQSVVRNNFITLDGGTGRATGTGAGLYINSGSLKLDAGGDIQGNVISVKGVDAGGNVGANARGGGLYLTNAQIGRASCRERVS